MTAVSPTSPTRPARKYRDDVLAAVSALLADRSEVAPRKMFGHPSFAVNGRLFACLYDDGLGIKLPPEQVPAALTRPGAMAFIAYGKTMRAWVYIVHDDPDAYARELDLIEAAIEYAALVASQPRPARRPRTRRASAG